MKFHHAHLAYCTNIHPAETWEETWQALKTHTLAVRDRVCPHGTPYAIGLRLSAAAAATLTQPHHLQQFKTWLEKENCYIFTINGFPYGAFHGTRVKENVYRPDWTTPERLHYTNTLFDIIAHLTPEGVQGSVSTLPASFKAFNADEPTIFKNLEACARHIETLSNTHQRDLHLGLEPEPLGHFENTAETLTFFDRLLAAAADPALVRRRIGINYDTCHFALEFDDCHTSLDALRAAGLRISKVHLSSALEFDPTCPEAIKKIQTFAEPTYLHQVIVQHPDRTLTRHHDLPDFLQSPTPASPSTARTHFHIPLYANPEPPLTSTSHHATDAITYLKKHPHFCPHFEIETYTWNVLPPNLQIPVTQQIAQEYHWLTTHSH